MIVAATPATMGRILMLEGSTGDNSVTEADFILNAVPADVYVATKPEFCTDESALKAMYMLPEVAVRGVGKLVPLNRPRDALAELGPSKTLT